jgi:NAD(P)-dependent dehydrogenase (short-subunit alcohol dehydrogenase family)
MSALSALSDRAGVLLHGGTLRNVLGGPPGERLREAVAGRVVLVTGASSGMGEALSRKLAAAGAHVLLVARTREKLEGLRAELSEQGGRAHVHPADMGEMDSAAGLAREVIDRHGHVDVLVNNAGHSIRRSIELSYDRFHDFERTININYLGPVRLSLGLLPMMRARRRGHIVNVSTIGVHNPAPRYAAYCASKAAFDTWLRCVAPEVRSDGVATTSLYFGLIHTPMSAATAVYRLLPGLTPDKAADEVCWALVSRPRTSGPLWARLTGMLGDAAPGELDRALGLYYRNSLDSARARGAPEEEEELEIPLLEGLARRVDPPREES